VNTVPDVSAQIAIYPLRQEHLSPVIDEALKEFRGQDLRIEPGMMSTLVMGSEESIFDAMREAFRKAREGGEVVMIVTLSNACPATAAEGEL
jgi:uncharacterized protein YqgV (UPF0045/DUF77 family)